MIRRLEQSENSILGFSVSGDVTDEEYTQAISHMRDGIAKHGKIRLLFRIEDFDPKSLFSGLEERADFVSTNASDIERLAVVNDSIAADIFGLASGLLSDIEVENFKTDEEEKAWAWLK